MPRSHDRVRVRQPNQRAKKTLGHAICITQLHQQAKRMQTLRYRLYSRVQAQIIIAAMDASTSPALTWLSMPHSPILILKVPLSPQSAFQEFATNQ